MVQPMNRKLLRGLVFDACGRGDRIPQRLRYLVEPIALAGNISHVLRLFFVDHSVPLSGVSPATVHYELLTATHSTEDWAETCVYYRQTPLIDFPARPG
jgi:hypothetical protein